MVVRPKEAVVSRPLINVTAKGLSDAVERNRGNRAELELLIRELGHRSTPSARQAAAKARAYMREINEGHGESGSSERCDAKVESGEVRQRREWTLEAIAGLRAKLIDLSKRNSLVSFKHSERGATYLRIIDERPDQLFGTLTEGQMRFEALPDEDIVPPDEQTDDFLISLERARLTDPDYLKAIEELGEEEEDAVALQKAERTLRAALRQELGLPKLQFGKSIDIAALARAHGFDPSFELPDTDDDVDSDHHRDNKIRVLLTEKQLDRRLSTIHDRYRSHERETGLHTLFLVFGFVEWFEYDDSELALHAPALLLPVHLERTLHRGRYTFTISGLDEDLQVNVAMRELLRQRFGIEVPELRPKTDVRDAEQPESYFMRLAGVLEETKRFRLRRFLTLAVLPFPRMVLWQDLDPAQWSDGAFDGHELLVRLLGADSSGGAPSFGEDYPIDEPTFGKTVPPLVTDADVSQHSALVDVAAGVPLALEGPPGTGKSQTITNMIAGALDAGKKVLFVAEKQAALGVVAERLRALGFGPLLLELHSDRATKAGLLDSLRERVEARVSVDPRNIDELQNSLQRQRTQLRTYLSLLRQPLGKLSKTAHQLIWRVLNLRPGIDDAAIVAGEAAGTLADAPEVDTLGLLKRREILEQIAVKVGEHVSAYGSVAGNAWSRAKKLDVFDTAATISTVHKAAQAAQTLANAVASTRSKTGYPVESDPKSILRQASSMSDAPQPVGLSSDALASVLSEPEAATSLLVDRGEWSGLSSSLTAIGVDPLAADEACINELDEALRSAALSASTVAEANREATDERGRHSALSALASDTLSLAERFGFDGSKLTVLQLRALTSALVEWNEASDAVRALCRSSIMDDGYPGAFESARASADELSDRRAAMTHVAPEGFAASPESLAETANTLENAGILQRIFGGEFKRQRRSAERILPGVAGRQELVERLRALRQLLLDETNFADNSAARSYFPQEYWHGCRSNWESLAEARSLAERTYDKLSSARIDQAISKIIDAPALELRAPMKKAEALAEPLRGLPASNEGLTFPVMLETLDRRCASLERVSNALYSLGLADGAPIQIGPRNVAEAIKQFRAFDSQYQKKDRPNCLSWAIDPKADARELQAAADYRSNLDTDLLTTLTSSDDPVQTVEQVRSAGRELNDLCDNLMEAGQQLERAVDTDLKTILPPEATAIESIAEILQQLSADEAGLRLAADLQRYLADADQQNCRFVVDLAFRTGVAADRLADLYELLVCRAVLGQYLRSDGEDLTKLGGLTLEAIRTRFAEIDSDLQSLEAKRINAERLADQAPWGIDRGPKSGWTQKALINNELSKKKRHIPIRDLTKRAGQALQAMKPVWMMSPSSVAQYVQPETVTFDLIVIDEASQMRPEYAVSAILRGQLLVVVGDSKQLPPTDFFQTSLAGMGDGGDGDDDESITVDTESILDLAHSRIGTRRQLNWHYRSRHESLIQFSNRHFYDRRLVVFPSPNTDDPLLGVKHFYVKGTYEASINQDEAEAVIRDAIGLMIAHPECSMGIATMNLKQTELIKAEFNRLAGEQEAVRNYIAAWEGGIDRFFVKNLENVQGDERDIILISTVYGPDQTGRVMQRFGPIASDVGHRRLNVLVTRARLSTRLFTSLRSGDVKIVESSKPGTVATQAYLTYAEGGAHFDLAEGGEPDSDFEVFVADRLRAAGFEVIHQVGVEKFRIDLGVRHPDYPLGFVAGIECDGARYHSGFTVRDRDKIRQAVLEGLGWKIYRVWSTDWFTDPDRETVKLIAQVLAWRDEAIENFRARYASGEFQDELPAPAPEETETHAAQGVPANDETDFPALIADAMVEAESEAGPRQIPAGRKRELDGIDWYEVETATLYEVWPDSEYGGEIEVISRAMGAPQIYGGGAIRIPKSEYRGTVEATGASFIENDIYAAVRKVAQLARKARNEGE